MNTPFVAPLSARSLSLNLRLGLLLALPLGFCTGGVSRADTIQYRVSFNDPNAYQFASGGTPYALDFFLTAGSNATSVRGSNFSGSGTSSPTTDFSLNNSSGEAGTTRAFSPPTTAPTSDSLGFDLFATYTPGSFDTFSFSIARNVGTANEAFIATTQNAQVGQSFFTIDFSSASAPLVSTFRSNELGFSIAAPTVTRVTAPVPEPSTWAMMALGVTALVLMIWKRKYGDSSDFAGAAI